MDISKKEKNLLDLPNEIILIIMKKLDMVDVLYSLVNVTQRFDHLVFNPTYIRTLDITCLRRELFPDRIYSTDSHVLERICQNIIPRINHQVNELITDQHSIERVLHTADYPQLHSLSLIDIDENFLLNLFQGDELLTDLLNTQITSLIIDVNDKPTDEESIDQFSVMFSLILRSCRRLNKFRFCSGYYREKMHPVCFSVMNCRSAILTELRVNINCFDECLYLFDGYFPSLSTLNISVKEIRETSRTRNNKEKILALKHFSLSSKPRTFCYDDQIIPLLQRMVNIEELTLFLSIIRIDSNYINGTQLHDDIIRYMPRLNKFYFSIDTAVVKIESNLVLSSNEDIQQSFIGREFGPVGSCVEIFSGENWSGSFAYALPHKFYSTSKIYTLPYHFAHYLFISNSFQKGIFERVRTLCMADMHPFEHEFFQIISQSFPLLEYLGIFNNEAQKAKQQSRTLITFPRLIHLYLHSAHADYAEQLLVEQYCHLPSLFELEIGYASLMSVTNHFTNRATHLTCSKLKRLRICEPFVRPEHFHQYFSSL